MERKKLVEKKRTAQNFGDLQDHIKWSNICVIGIPEGGSWGQIIKIHSNDQRSTSKKGLVLLPKPFYIIYDINFTYTEHRVCISLSVRLSLQSGIENMCSNHNPKYSFPQVFFESSENEQIYQTTLTEVNKYGHLVTLYYMWWFPDRCCLI